MILMSSLLGAGDARPFREKDFELFTLTGVARAGTLIISHREGLQDSRTAAFVALRENSY